MSIRVTDFALQYDAMNILRNPRLVLALILLLLTGCGVEPLQPLDENAVILAFGDSLTFGTGVEPPEAYPPQLAQLTGRTVINGGVAGELSDQSLARLRGTLVEHHPALVILCIGTSDILTKKPFTETVLNITAMVKLIRETGAEILMLAVPNYMGQRKGAEFSEDLADELDIPIETKVLTHVWKTEDLQSDLIHPNAAGYKLIAERVDALLREAGALELKAK